MQEVKEKGEGEDEYMFYDEKFINALEYRLRPTGGWAQVQIEL